ncbi:hypothetical protein [Novosphingobium sp. PASSN1]|nr:hypothetical protein [Novosphingobium sp. PASSN1]
MSKSLILFGIWCAFLVACSGVAAWYGWAPFPDNERPSSASYRGPTHK